MDYTIDMLVEANILPYYAAEELPWDCEVCGNPIVYNEALTVAKCINPNCKGRMAAYAAAIAADLGYKYIGYNTLLKTFEKYDLKTYLDVFSKEFLNNIPAGTDRVVDLLKKYTATPVLRPFYVLFKYLFVPGMQSEWEDVVGTAHKIEDVSLENLPARYSNLTRKALKLKLPLLHKIEYLFKFVYRRSQSVIEIMITGPVESFPNKEAFITYLNREFGDYHTFKQVGKKKSSHICICDSYGADGRPFSSTPKYRTACECNIPILFSKEFIAILKNEKEIDANDT